jgi:prophage DNA circulation protein
MSPITLILEGSLGLLLAACLFYCWRLDRKLAALRDGQDGIREAARELNASVASAEAAIKSLRQTAHEAGRDLQGRIDTASAIAEKLGLALGRVRSMADLSRGGRS